jgi:parallel beta-helix repeat protein
MAKQVQLRRGTTSEHSTFTGAVGEVTVDTTKDTLVVHDGSTTGGIPLAKQSSVDLKAGTVPTVSGLASIVSPSIGDTVVAIEEGRGGVFIYRADGTPNGGTIFDSSSTGKWHRQYEGSVNVKWFGAVGDGVADDTVAIQSALVLKNIYIPLGTYIHSGLSYNSSDLKIIGEGKLEYNGTSDAFLISSPNNTNLSNIHISGVSFKNGVSCLKIVGSGTGIFSKILIEKCTFDTSTSGMLWFEQCSNTTINDNYFVNAGDNGIYYASSGVGIITNNIVRNCRGSGGITVGYGNPSSRTSNVLISNNSVYTDSSALPGHYISGICVVMADTVEVSNNIISVKTGASSFIKTGILIEEHGLRDIAVSDNHIMKCSEYGLRVGSAANSRIDSLNVKNNSFSQCRDGIQAERLYNSRITNNIFTYCSHYGINVLSSCVSLDIEDNIFEDCSMQNTWGSYMFLHITGHSIKVLNNTFIDSQNGGTITSSATSPTYSISSSGILTLYSVGIAIATIITTDKNWATIKSEIEANSGWVFTLLNACGEAYPSWLRRTGYRWSDNVQQYPVNTIITTPEPYLYISIEAGNAHKISGNKYFTNTSGLPNHHANGYLFQYTTDTESDVSIWGEITPAGYSSGSFSPNARPESGTYASVASTGKYIKIGGLVTITIDIDLVDTTGGSNSLLISLPYTAEGTPKAVGHCLEYSASGISGFIDTNGSLARLKKYDYTNPFASGQKWCGTLSYKTT